MTVFILCPFCECHPMENWDIHLRYEGNQKPSLTIEERKIKIHLHWTSTEDKKKMEKLVRRSDMYIPELRLSWSSLQWPPIQQAKRVAIQVTTIIEKAFVKGLSEWHDKHYSKNWQIPKVRNVALTAVILWMKTDGCKVTAIMHQSRYSSIVS